MIDTRIANTERVSNFHFLIDLDAETNLNPIPGQFFMLKVNDLNDPFFMRPFSVFDADKNILRFLIEIKGNGTKILSRSRAGDILKIRGPLGNGFQFGNVRKALLYAGGTGIAPMFYLAKNLKKNGVEVDVILGFRNRDRVIFEDSFAELGEVFVYTDDGSYREKGNVADFVLKKEYDGVFACGPVPMLKAIQRRHKNAQISLESVFACGAGACMGCVVKSVSGYVRVCKDGPVFYAGDVII
ncbi:dihydroorotate dehydrogenase electron transfer subunit [Thermodesulfobium sp. 4217-1]|uniref:dihydroorotate dehydrogenase electron transfer subunit n=1 Tax=Thermodesulfobium sp. 4217-1 TaxID=3120013 RepID=UPI003221615C